MNKIIIINAVCMSLLISCKSEIKTEEVAQKPIDNAIVFTTTQYKNLKIEIGGAEEKIMDINIEANGLVDVPPDQMFAINYPLSGVISNINHNLLPGKYLKKGEALGQIQSMELLQIQEDYLNETTKGELMVQDFERQKSLIADDATSKRKFQETDNALKINRIKIKSLSEKLKLLGINPGSLTSANISAKHTLHAAQNGYVKSVNVTNGSSFTSNEKLFELISTQHMHIELKVFGDDMQLVKEGQEVDFTNTEGKSTVGKVYLIDKTVDTEQKSLNLHVHIENEAFEQSLRPGQYISGRINVKNSKVLALPESAILANSDGSFIFRMKEEKSQVKFEKIEVKTGRIAHGFIEIIEPSDLSGKIVTRGVNFVENGASEE
ncbi:efflux RND transporter periplasmic adaptor subunit [Lacihabitans sp. CS3-21]|uniref:efflux RND transporter periplasmic adaptor subunit n=1 Tax=Lacihabitans sp. CS3-21 TaxID=2487332 RepID=UPI0020CE8C79|nr:efflux RND transporter periplasmic adaptor subunit [Lacihabitans sp. CS3-21]MCP9748865.1 efflux RND transporter periplasmic adaptor subunit [Lacihabitans sp. CS3-21]